MSLNALEQEIERRVAGLVAEARAAAGAWERERRLLWARVASRVELLTGHLAMARRSYAADLATTRLTGRARAAAAYDWLDRFDREGHAMGRDIWEVLRAAHVADVRSQREIAAHVAGLRDFGASLRREAEAAALETRAPSGTPPPAAAAARERVARRMRELHADLGSLTAAIEAQLGRALAERQPDWEHAADRFAQRLIERLGGDAPAAAPSTAPVRRAPPVKRPLAKIPRFLLNRFYNKGGLRIVTDGVQITFVNPLAFCIVQGGDAVVIDDRPFPKERTMIDNGEKRLASAALSSANYMKFPKGAALTVHLDGLQLARGAHRFVLALEMRKLGWVNLDFKDEA